MSESWDEQEPYAAQGGAVRWRLETWLEPTEGMDEAGRVLRVLNARGPWLEPGSAPAAYTQFAPLPAEDVPFLRGQVEARARRQMEGVMESLRKRMGSR